MLEEIARIGGGRNYFADDPLTIPQIFAKETVAASKSAINEQPFMPQVVRPTKALAEIDFATAPFLLGYVVTRPKPTSEVILATESGDPLLTWWRYGLGMCVAFTSDAKTPLGRRVARLAGLRQVLGAGRPPRDAQERVRGVVSPGRPQGPAMRSSRSTPSTRPASSSTTPRPS